jgi:hypothetical protein
MKILTKNDLKNIYEINEENFNYVRGLSIKKD